MERMTKRENGHVYYPRCFEEPCGGMGCLTEDCGFKVEICERLAAYEDTGLEPDEVNALQKDWSDLCTVIGECGGIDRLRELAEATRTVGLWCYRARWAIRCIGCDPLSKRLDDLSWELQR